MSGQGAAQKARNMWRSLTSMGTALVLLFLLALAAIPGALLPQRGLNAAKVDDYLAAHPLIGPWLDELQAFDVFSSFWFTAIYVLLFVSLGAWRDPRVWWQLRNPFTPSWGEPYVDIAARMTTAVDKARVRGAGHEVVCVSHQLPVWTLRLYLTGKRLWHDPRRRDCALASVTSLIYDGDRLVDVVYSQPAAL